MTDLLYGGFLGAAFIIFWIIRYPKELLDVLRFKDSLAALLAVYIHVMATLFCLIVGFLPT